VVIKTFNIDEEVYKEFSAYCKKHGISMSKRVGNFLKEEVIKLKGKHSFSKKVVSGKNDSIKGQHVGHHSFSKYC